MHNKNFCIGWKWFRSRSNYWNIGHQQNSLWLSSKAISACWFEFNWMKTITKKRNKNLRKICSHQKYNDRINELFQLTLLENTSLDLFSIRITSLIARKSRIRKMFSLPCFQELHRHNVVFDELLSTSA